MVCKIDFPNLSFYFLTIIKSIVLFNVALVTGKPIAAKPSKIVAGHDADRTNEFLQAIAESVNKKVGLILNFSNAFNNSMISI